MKKDLGLWRMNDVFTEWISKNHNNIIDTDLTYYTTKVYEDPLNIALAEFLNLDQHSIFTAAGINQLIHSILNWSNWRKVFIMHPEYGLYEKVAEQAFKKDNIVVINTTIIEDFISKISQVESTEDDILCFSSPRWYNGERFSKNNIEEILKRFKGTVLIDEAYVDFSYNKDQNLELAKTNDRVILMRSFSKGWFVQGLRVGYAITNRFDEKFRGGCIVPHPVSAPASRFIELLVRDEKIMKLFEAIRENIIRTREFLYNKLKEINGVHAFKSESNFLTVLIDNPMLKNNLLKFRYINDIQKGEQDGVKIWITSIEDAKEYVKVIVEKYN